jgi:hypothetical protein
MIFPSREILSAEVLSRASEDTSYPKLRRILLSLLMAIALSGCGIYNGGFERGGDLTSNFLERIQENPKDQEDQLLPKFEVERNNNNKEVKKCSKLSQK